MGFFSELKEDLSQAVNELLPDEGDAAAKTIPDSAEGSEELSERTDADNLMGEIGEILAELPIEEGDGQKIEGDGTSASEQEETPVEEGEIPENVAEAKDPASESENEALNEFSEEISEILAESQETPDFEKADQNEETAEGWKVNEEEKEGMKMETENLENEVIAEEMTETAETVEENNEDNGGFRMDSQLENRQPVDETAVITAGMTIQGDIISEGSMEVIGNIVGNIDILGKLNITGAVEGNSKAAEIYCESAKITGEIASEGSVKIGQSTVIIGNISANSAVIAGAVKGDIDVHGPVVLDTSAIVMGNIKSKSVQINNGAVIEGMCSQCYADVNPSSFFEDFKAMTKKKK